MILLDTEVMRRIEGNWGAALRMAIKNMSNRTIIMILKNIPKLHMGCGCDETLHNNPADSGIILILYFGKSL